MRGLLVLCLPLLLASPLAMAKLRPGPAVMSNGQDCRVIAIYPGGKKAEIEIQTRSGTFIGPWDVALLTNVDDVDVETALDCKRSLKKKKPKRDRHFIVD